MSPVSKWKGNDNISHIGILERKKNRVKCINIFPLEFSKLCLTVKAKFITPGFPGGTVVKNPPANAGDMGLSPGPGRSHMPQSN